MGARLTTADHPDIRVLGFGLNALFCPSGADSFYWRALGPTSSLAHRGTEYSPFRGPPNPGQSLASLDYIVRFQRPGKFPDKGA